MKKFIAVLGLLILVGIEITVPRTAGAAMSCNSNGSACRASDPGACCSGNCNLASPGDAFGKCKAVDDA